MIRLLRRWLRNSAPTVPKGPLPVLRRSRADFDVPPESGARVTWLGHATSLVEIDGTRLLIDPVWAERASPVSWFGPRRFFAPPLPLDDLPEIDAVLVSHDHYDHLDKIAVKQLAAGGHRFVVPTGVGAVLIGWGVHQHQVIEVAWWDRVEVGSVEITATPTQHFSGRSLLMHDRNRTGWCGFAIRGASAGIYYAGDSGPFGGFAEVGRRLGPFDATLVEIGAYDRMWADIHLGPECAVDAVVAARGGLMIPIHWATFNLAMHGWTEPAERVRVAAARAGVPLAIPRPGASVDPHAPPPVEVWWPDLPWERAEDHGRAGTSAPAGKGIGE